MVLAFMERDCPGRLKPEAREIQRGIALRGWSKCVDDIDSSLVGDDGFVAGGSGGHVRIDS